ncbi:MAG TPA: YihY/virulence factor BrkB family protein, partial [Acidimicrobiales bacterium]
GLAWSGSGVAVALQQGVRAPWQLRPEGIKDRITGLLFLVAGAVGFAAVIALGGLLAHLPHAIPPVVGAVAIVAVGLAAEVGLFLWMFWALGDRRIPWRDLVPGAVLAAVGFEILKLVGTVYVPHLVAQSSSLYGPLGVVFAILAWLALFARLIVYCSALNAVRYEAREGTVTLQVRAPRLPGPIAADGTRGGTIVVSTPAGTGARPASGAAEEVSEAGADHRLDPLVPAGAPEPAVAPRTGAEVEGPRPS